MDEKHSQAAHVERLSDDEKQAVVVDHNHSDILLNVDSRTAANLALAKDGKTVLIPQPSSDPNDPLNWSSGKKHAILLILAFGGFMADFSSSMGVSCIGVQGVYWNMSPNHVNYAGNLNVVMVGVGGLLCIPLLSFWGRAPVMFWTTVLGTIFALVSALAKEFDTYYAARALLGLTLTAGQCIGLAFIRDMFFFHEHARKIGIWASIFLASPYLGALFGNMMVGKLGEWRPCMWLIFALCVLLLALVVLFVDETWYRRDIPPSQQPDRGTRIMRVVGVWQISHHNDLFYSFTRSCRPLITLLFKPLTIPTLFYYGPAFMWAIGINITSVLLLQTPVAKGGYGYSSVTIGCIYFTPVVAVILGEGFGHIFNDWMANRYLRRNNGVFKPEVRLWVNYIGTVFMVPGLILVGQALHNRLNVSAFIFGWGMYVFGVMIASVGVTSYLLDVYFSVPGEVGAWLNFARTLSGFSVGYFQVPWGVAQGYDVSFGIQAAIVFAATLWLGVIHYFSEGLRKRSSDLTA